MQQNESLADGAWFRVGQSFSVTPLPSLWLFEQYCSLMYLI